MKNYKSFSCFFFFFFIFSLPILSCLAQLTPSQSSAQSPSIACKSTPYPKLCLSILKAFTSSPSNSYNYGKFSVKQCLKQAQRLSKVIRHHLTHRKERSKFAHMEAAALDDCRELMDLNVDYLQSISVELKSVELMTEELVDRVTSLLSGIVTNQQTCFDELEDSKSGIAAVLYEPLSNVTRLYSVSLGLVTHALDRNMKNKRTKRSKTWFLKNSNRVREPLERLIKVNTWIYNPSYFIY